MNPDQFQQLIDSLERIHRDLAGIGVLFFCFFLIGIIYTVFRSK